MTPTSKPDPEAPGPAGRPRVVLSRCLNLEPVRYNGVVIEDRFAAALGRYVDFLSVCPEVQIGLGVPRSTLRLARNGNDIRLLQPDTGRDWTARMNDFSETFLTDLPPVDGFLLKARSPSCGAGQVKVYDSAAPGPAVASSPGLFARAVQERFPGIPVEDEGRMQDPDLRHHFLLRVFTLHRFRQLGPTPDRRTLTEFQARHKWLLLACNQTRMRRIGRLIAESREPAQILHKQVRSELEAALARRPPARAHLNVLEHGIGYVRKALRPRERSRFDDRLAAYGRGEIPLSVPLELLRAFLLRHDVEYGLTQVYLDPFPETLLRA